MSFIDENDRNDKRSKTPWHDPENPVSEQDLQDWQNRQREQRRQRLPEEDALSELARKMQPEMEAAGFSNPFSYVAHLNARGGSHPRQGEMQAKFRHEIVPGGAGEPRQNDGPDDNPSMFVQAQNRSPQSLEKIREESQGKAGVAPVVEPEIGGNPALITPAERDRLIRNTLPYEGGINASPRDPGNRGGTVTNRGITQSELDSFRRKNPNAEFPTRTSELTEDQTIRMYDEIYLRDYRIGEIADPRLRAMVFDMAVNSGYSTAIEELQKVMNVRLGMPVDSRNVLGSGMIATLNDLARRKQDSVLGKLALDFYHARLEFIDRLVKKNPNLQEFEKGWIERAKDFEPLRDPFLYTPERKRITPRHAPAKR